LGQQLYLRAGCQSCHGENGNTPKAPGFPKLAGQDMTYLVNQLLFFSVHAPTI
jgi:cytochrome c553